MTGPIFGPNPGGMHGDSMSSVSTRGAEAPQLRERGQP